MNNLFEDNGAIFSECRGHRYVLYRIWDKEKPCVMFIGLNPSVANETANDPTIRRVISFAKLWGYGGVYMTNLFSMVSTDPKKLIIQKDNTENDRHLTEVSSKCQIIVYAYGNFEVFGRDKEVLALLPAGYALQINKNGTPKHPLYVKADITPVPFNHERPINY
jgi:hypothetical protein